MSKKNQDKKNRVKTDHTDQRISSLEATVQYLMDRDSKKSREIDLLKEKLKRV